LPTGDGEVVLVALAVGPRARALRGHVRARVLRPEAKTLLLARDHVGIKPLYYASTPAGVVFIRNTIRSSRIRGPRMPRVDRDGLGLYLRFGFLPALYGLHAGSGRSRQDNGCASMPMAASSRRTTHVARVADTDATRASAIDAPRQHSAAVPSVTSSDVEVGVLPRAIDSPLVAAEAARHRKLKAFTIGVDDPEMDESADARRYANEIGLDLIEERVRTDDVLGLLEDVVAASTEPAADYSMFPMLVVSRLAQRHVKVVLSGDGGDELYWGYPSRFASAISLAPYFAWPRPARYGAIAMRRWLGRGAATRDVVDYSNIGRLYQRKHTLLAEADLEALFPTLPAMPADFRAFEFDEVDPDRVAQWVRWNELHVHLARVLAKVDRASMYHSLEVRVPLLDKRVIEVAWQTDWKSCLDLAARKGKLPLREVLARRVKYQTSSKKGFTVPMAAWLVGPLQPLVRQHLLDRDELLGLPMRRAAMAEHNRRLCAGDRSKAWGMWLLLSLAMWQQRYGR
jgi:asparagine synthase (glutamine-hydrolysing)